MKISLIVGGVSLLVGIQISRLIIGLRRNRKLAQKSGYPYILVPVQPLEPWWFAIAPIVAPLIRRLPESWREPWSSLIDFRRVWNNGGDTFERLGADSFVVVSPHANVLWTRDPDAFQQVGNTCGNPPGNKNIWRLYGPNLFSSDPGHQRRIFRKTVASAFGEATHEKVWHTALNEIQAMLSRWQPAKDGSKVVPTLNQDTGDLMLHVTSESLYCRSCQWDVVKQDPEKRNGVMDYDSAIKAIIENMYMVFFTPKALLRNIPFSSFRRANAAYEDWGYHMRKLRDDRQTMSISAQKDLPKDLLGALVNAKINNLITADDVTGNMFFTLIAGHETTSTTLSFALAVLAVLPEVQSEVRAEVDRILTSDASSDWTYRGECSLLLDGYVGAVICETLRLWTPLPAFMKVNEGQDQTISLNKGDFTLHQGTGVLLHTAATHAHPAFWPPPEPSPDGDDRGSLPFPLCSYDPKRWFKDHQHSTLIAANAEQRSWIEDNDPNRESKRRRVAVQRGLFSPFGEGPTACPGSRMAMVEFAACLAYICKHWYIHPGPVLSRTDEIDQQNTEARSRAHLIRQITKEVKFNLVVQTIKPISIRLVPRKS